MEMAALSPTPTSSPESQRWRPSKFMTPAQQASQGVNFTTQTSGHVVDADSASARDDRTGSKSTGRVRGAQWACENFRARPFQSAKRSRSVQAVNAAFQRRLDRKTIKQVQLYNARRDDAGRRSCSFPSSPRFWNEEPRLPELSELESVVHRAFKPRMELEVLICDIKADCAETSIATLGDIEQFWKEKPVDVIVRWIHAPVGQGLLHSSIEDMFRHDWEQGKPFRHAGPSVFPYVEVESLHFREWEDLQHLRDVREALEGHGALTTRLTTNCLNGNNNPTLEADLKWREHHLQRQRNFWDLAVPDMPYELSESLTFQGPLRLGSSGRGQLERSAIGREPGSQFEGTKLVVAPFRCFHRNDGVLLTMSAATGVDQIHKDFRLDIGEDLVERMTNENASVVANTMTGLAETGAADWYEQNVEWLVVHLVTEIGIGPKNFASGLSALSVLATLQGTIVELKKRRYDRWEPRKTVQLVQDYLLVMDDLKVLSLSLGRRLDLFERLLLDTRVHEQEAEISHTNNKDAESPSKRVEWAIRVVSEDKRVANEMYEDISQALNTLFQLRSVEQNELAMLTDSQNRALFVFTGVTVVFLPLSFLTSYYGMNVVGIRDTLLSESGFWKICGPAAFGIFSCVLLCASLYRRFDSARSFREREQERQTILDGLERAAIAKELA